MPMRSTAIISPKGQIVIPAGLRKRYGLREGTTVQFHEERGQLILEASNYEAIYALEGSLRDFPIEADLEEERRAARKHENRR
jgi:AbrB family looped-hinge helix DNA binding protein